jgi:hypothetical protein
MRTIDTIKVESDERGFELHITDDEGEEFHFNMHQVAEALWDDMRKTVGPWIAEMHAMKREYEASRVPGDDDLDDGPWAGEGAMDFYRRTGNDEPLRDLADGLRDRAKEGA